MDINDILRGFFGFGHLPPRPPHSIQNEGSDNENYEERRFRDPFDDDVSSLFRHMEDMFSNMFSLHTGFLDFPNLEMMPNEANPRDLMLKDSAEPNCNKLQPIDPLYKNQKLNQPLQKDIDLDEVYAKGGLSAVDEYESKNEVSPRSWSFRKSISTKVVRSPDGVIEEHKTFTDNNGKIVTTVRKTIGDKTYQVTTESDKAGLIEKKEDFINIDEREAETFQQDWSRNSLPLKASVNPKENLPISAPPGDHKYSQIFKKFFGL